MEVKGGRVQLQGIIYIDSVFLLNLVMDLYLLSLTAKALGKNVSFRRVLREA
ncbi:MAG: sigma-E processing peptidase SpoIIGA [Clostridium sp.]|nr:sigma-E processing peptidase SpoIIGA [Clostridium sp.]